MSELTSWIDRCKSFGITGIVATNGVFDVIHAGHVRFLRKAQSLGRLLVVGINSDSSVKQLKGESRPIFNQFERAELLRELSCVDEVFIFDDLRATNFLNALRPDVWVKGGDYTMDTLCKEEKDAVQSYGGKIVLIPSQSVWSTTKVLNSKG